jgi:hypothetical protein
MAPPDLSEPPSVYVRFERHEVEIRSDAPALVSALAASFRHMLGTGSGQTVARIEIVRAGGALEGRGPVGAYTGDGSPEALLRWARYQAIEQLIAARTDLLWLHGAAAGWGGRAVVMPGTRGRGKSTLVAQLLARGWTFLTDDILPVDPHAFRVLPFPQVPAVRPDPGRDLPEGWLRQVPKAEVPVNDRVSAEPLPVGALVLPHARRAGDADLAPCSAAEAALELARGCWNFAQHGERAVAVLARLAADRPAFRLTFKDADRAADLLAAWAGSAWGPR